MKTHSRFTTSLATDEKNTQLESLEVQIGLVWYPLSTIAPLFDTILITENARNTVAGTITWDMWLNYPGKIQQIRFTDGTPALVNITRDVLTDNVDDVFEISKSVQAVPEFLAGVSYLVPFNAGAVTEVCPPMIPNYVQENGVDGLFLSTTWKYDSAEQMQVRNANTFDAYTVATKLKQLDKAIAEKAIRKSVESKMMLNSLMK